MCALGAGTVMTTSSNGPSRWLFFSSRIIGHLAFHFDNLRAGLDGQVRGKMFRQGGHLWMANIVNPLIVVRIETPFLGQPSHGGIPCLNHAMLLVAPSFTRSRKRLSWQKAWAHRGRAASLDRCVKCGSTSGPGPLPCQKLEHRCRGR